jgi:CelD/BcsL family acetyltransferase involved in cellulose biosynthesis
VRLELVDPHSPRVERVWNSLACPSYFLSWGWVENWLACLPREVTPPLAIWNSGATAAFLARRLAVRHHVVASRALHLNVTGVPRFDELWIEYNGVAGAEPTLAELVAELPRGWDELVLPGVRAEAFGGMAAGDRGGYRVVVARHVPAYYVDLARVRAGGFLPLLSGQTRSQIRRAQKTAGPLEVEVAGDVRRAIAIYDELSELHGVQWRAKGMVGAFADPWFDRFHRRLVATRFAAGEIQLVRVRAGGTTLGCLYNLVWQGRVLQYQTGLRMTDDARAKPGFVCHTAAIEHSAAAGLAVYDLLAGDMRYKKSLSTGLDWLSWCVVQRPRLRFALEDRLVDLVRARRERSVVAPPHAGEQERGDP